MASAPLLKDIEELSLQCSVCSKQLNEPKQLSCLHRFCRACLENTVKDDDRKVQCPTCQTEHELPEDGVDGLKTDFSTQNIVECIQLRASAKSEPSRICIGCTKELRAAAYCFKCSDFLCQGCHEYHVTSMIVKGHRPHILPLDDAEARDLTVEELSSMKEPPTCRKHPGKTSELCCTTCGKLLICMACTYGVHKGHDFQDVSSLAEMEREKLLDQFGNLMKYEEKILQMQDRMKDAAESLAVSLTKEKKNLEEEFSREEGKTKAEIQQANDNLKKRKKELKKIRKKKESQRKQELEEAMKELQDNYDNACQEDQREIDAERDKFHEENRKVISELEEALTVKSDDFQRSLSSVNDRGRKQEGEIKESADRCNGLIKSFENVTKVAPNLLAAKHDWTDVHCIPDVLAVIASLTAEVDKELCPQQTTLVGATSSEGSVNAVHGGIEGESLFDIEGNEQGDSCIDGVACSDDGTLVVTGITSHRYLYFLVATMEGELLRRNEVPMYGCFSNFCDLLSTTKVATAHDPCQVGIYDIRSGKHTKVDISFWKGGDSWFASSITVNHKNNQITVGSSFSRKFFVLGDRLQLIRCLTLPELIQNPLDICSYGDNLLVCDGNGQRAFVVTTGADCKVVHELGRPGVGGSDDAWRPCLVCASSTGSIYMVWRDDTEDRGEWIIVEYSADAGHAILRTSSVRISSVPRCMTTVSTAQGEKLLLVTARKLMTCATR